MDAAFFEDLDLDALLASFAQSASAASGLLSPSPAPPPRDAGAGSEAGSPESVTSRAGCPRGEEALSEIERFLMEEDPAEAGGSEGISVEEFFDALFDGGEGEGEKGGEGEDGGGTDEDSAKENEAAPDAEKVEVEEVDGADPISKKKRSRQMRNRDSAMKSRERKKMYIKDLETKSKYLEAECCRLSYALQCCTAENMALRRSMLKDRPVGAPTAMQESAVLTETLPMVSLLWLVSIVCLFLLPGQPNRSMLAPSSTGRDLAMVPGKRSSDKPETVELIPHGRRCKGTRVRIKLDTLPLHAAPAPAPAC